MIRKKEKVPGSVILTHHIRNSHLKRIRESQAIYHKTLFKMCTDNNILHYLLFNVCANCKPKYIRWVAVRDNALPSYNHTVCKACSTSRGVIFTLVFF